MALDWLSYWFPWFERLINPLPLLLIDNGRLLTKNMRQELVTRDGILSKLRELGIEEPAQVERPYLEADGQLSVAPRPPSTEDVPDPFFRKTTFFGARDPRGRV